MELILLTVPDGPNAAGFEERLALALADGTGTAVLCREVADKREAVKTRDARLPDAAAYFSDTGEGSLAGSEGTAGNLAAGAVHLEAVRERARRLEEVAGG